MTSRRPASLALGALLVGLLPAALAAQTAIRVGQSVSGTIADGDGVASDNSLYDDYVLQASAGQRLVITLRSSDFDTFLVWGTGVGGSFSRQEYDDDGAGGTDSRLEVTVGSGGRYTIRANALTSEMRGRYTLSVESAGGGGAAPGPSGPSRPSAGGAGTISAGQTVAGRLDGNDPLLGDNSHYDQYVYRGRPGERIVVTMRSSDFDTFLYGGTLSGGSFQQQVTDDDGAGGTDSRIEATLSGDGSYVIRANSLAANETGSYTLSVTSSAGVGGGPSGPRGAPGTLSVGQSVSGRLDSSDPRIPQDDSFYDQYVIRGQPNQAVTISMSSSAFDTYLIGGRGAGSQFQGTDYDDDSGGGTNSRLQVTLDGGGSYTVRANALRSGMTGAYTLSVEGSGGGGQTTARGSAITLGQTVSGQLTNSDPTLPDNSHYDWYVYRGTPGQQVLVTMRSSAFDTYLAWGRANGNALAPEGNDDDSGGGTDSQGLATVPASGQLLIQANSLAANETGAYTLTVAAPGQGTPSRPRPVPTGAQSVAAGQTINGTLANGDLVMSDTSLFDRYVYSGNPGDRLEIVLRSSAFDTFLRWGHLSGNDADIEATDDDGAGGTDSRLEVTVGSAGTYVIDANSFEPRKTGAYTLTVRRLTASAGPPRDPNRAPSRPSTGPARPTSGPARPSTGGSNKWRYNYMTTNQPAFRNLETRMKQAQILEMFSQDLTAQFPMLPDNAAIELRLAQCNNVNAFYSPRDHAVTFCYELLNHLAQRFVSDGQWNPEQEEAVRGAIQFIMMHEVGHALIDVLDLPTTGREEDAVDQLATVMLVGTGEKGAQAALNGVLAIQPGRDVVFDQSDYGDEHSLGPQRFFNVVCWIYGSDPSKYRSVAQRAGLPQDRAVRCRDEYDRLSKAWMRLLGRSQ